MSCGCKDKPTLTPAKRIEELRASIDLSFQNGHPGRAAERRWFICMHRIGCTRCACEHLGIVPGEEATCKRTTGIDSFKDALPRRDFQCPQGRF